MSLPARPSSRIAVAAGVFLIIGVVGAGCGAESTSESAPATSSASPSESSDSTASETPSESPSSSTATTIDITITATDVDPSGEQLKVQAGEPITLRITAETAGELHVHSSPEQEIQYAAGTTEKTLVLEQPGLVDVEDHGLDKLIVKLEVR